MQQLLFLLYTNVRIGIDAFNYYTEKLSKLLTEGKVKSKNHYATIMKWYLEDSEV